MICKKFFSIISYNTYFIFEAEFMYNPNSLKNFKSKDINDLMMQSINSY